MSIGTVGVIGAGQMGAGVAQVAAQSGQGEGSCSRISRKKYVARGHESVARNLDRMVQRGRFKGEERDQILRQNRYHTARLEDLRDTDFVLEAVVENEDAKIALFQKLDKGLPRARDLRVEYLVDFDHADGRAHQPRRSFHRHAFHEPGACDAPG